MHPPKKRKEKKRKKKKEKKKKRKREVSSRPMLGASESESLCGNIIENLEEKYG